MDANEAARRVWDLRVNMSRVALSMLHHNADAEDAVSTAMMRVCQRISTLKKEDVFNAWAMTILVRCCHDIIRKRKKEVLIDTPDIYDAPVIENTADSIFEIIQAMPDIFKNVLILHYYEGFKAAEIAGILSVPLGTVLVRLSRGRAKLKEILLREGDAAV